MPIPTENPIVTIPVSTPFDGNDSVNYDALSRNIERWLSTKLGGFVIGTASGEEWFLSEDEKLKIARTVAPILDEKRFLVGGIDCPGITETLRRAEAFAEAGAEMVRVRLPRYEDSLIDYFEAVTQRCPVPIMLMHQCNPERFGFAGDPAATPEVIGEVCSMDNVFGYTTDHDIRFESRVRRCIPQDKRFWICNGSLILSGTMIGCNGTTTAFSNIWPDALHELLTLGLAGRHDEARPLQDKIQRIDAIMLPYTAAGIKAALNLLGFEGTHPRKPTKPMPPEVVRQLEAVMRETGLLE